MRPLIPDTPKAHVELTELLLAHGLKYRERSSNFLFPASVWVEEADYERAVELISSIDARHTREAREQWANEWENRYHGSYGVWFLQKMKRPSNWWRVVALAVMLGMFLIYPLMHILRK